MNSSRICCASGRAAFTWATAFPATSLTWSASGRASFTWPAAWAAALPAALPAPDVAGSSGRYWNWWPVGLVSMCVVLSVVRSVVCSVVRRRADSGMARVTDPVDHRLPGPGDGVDHLLRDARRRFLCFGQALCSDGGDAMLGFGGLLDDRILRLGRGVADLGDCLRRHLLELPPVGDLVADLGDKLILGLFRLLEKLVGLLLCDLDQLVLEVRLLEGESLDRSSEPVPRLFDLFDQRRDIAASGRLIVPATHAHSLLGWGCSRALTASPLRASTRIGPSGARR